MAKMPEVGGLGMRGGGEMGTMPGISQAAAPTEGRWVCGIFQWHANS